MSTTGERQCRQLPERQQAPRLAAVGLALLLPGMMLAVVIVAAGTWMDDRDLATNIWFADLGSSTGGSPGGARGALAQVSTWLSWIGAGERTLQVVIVVAALLVMAR